MSDNYEATLVEANKTLRNAMFAFLFMWLAATAFLRFDYAQQIVKMKFYGEHHFKLHEMSSAEVLCRDSAGKWCMCGSCS